jgi:PEP-CTERM motif
VKLIPKMLLGLGLAALPAFCNPIVLNQWYLFTWNTTASLPTPGLDTGGTSASTYPISGGLTVSTGTCAGSSPCTAEPWTFTGQAVLNVQDLFHDGDRFEIFDNGTSKGMTSIPSSAAQDPLCGNDPLVCALDPNFSSGSFIISGSGAHSITIMVTQRLITTSSGAAFELTAVPEPTTLSLMGLGLGLGGLLLRWRARRKA